MGFTIEELRRVPDGAMYTSPARICVGAAGELVEETDPRAVRLLVAAGGQIPATEAAEYGLIAGVEVDALAAKETAAEADANAEEPADADPSEEPAEDGAGAGVEVDALAAKETAAEADANAEEPADADPSEEPAEDGAGAGRGRGRR